LLLATVQARRFLEYVRTLPFTEVVEEEKDFRKAVKDCNAVPADEFFDELERRLDRHYSK
jgi:hypothetical protein